jgi:hypothetical protein
MRSSRLARRGVWYGCAVSASHRQEAITWDLDPGVVQLADGRRVRARGLAESPPPVPSPEFGLYLLAERPPAVEWEQRWLLWRNF